MPSLGPTNFTALDWVIVGVYLLATVGIGLIARKAISSMSDYVVAGRGVGAALGVASLTGGEMGLITVMYSAQKGFSGGFAAFHIGLVAGIMALLVGLTGFILVRLRQTGVLTIPEFYERRFGRKTRILGAVLLACGGILNMGLFLKVGSLFVVGITGLEEGAALSIIMIVLLVLVLVYTVLGGMVSVVLTDYVQFVVLSAGLLVTTFLAVGHVGWDAIFTTVLDQKGEAGFNPLSEGDFGVEYVLWQAFIGIVNCAIWQTAVLRALSAESPAVVRKQFTWSSLAFLVRFMVPCFWGICAFVFVKETVDLNEAFFPAKEGTEAADSLMAMPVFLGRILPAGLIGIITAAMLAAFMSTHDTYLLCWSSVITQDIVAPLRKAPLSDASRIRLTRILIVVIGIYILYWGLVYEGDEDIWDYLGVSGAIYFTGAFSVLLFGLYWKGASSTGAALALLCGLSSVLGLSPVQRLLGLSLPVAWVGLGAVGLSVIAMLAGSFLFPDRKEAA